MYNIASLLIIFLCGFINIFKSYSVKYANGFYCAQNEIIYLSQRVVSKILKHSVSVIQSIYVSDYHNHRIIKWTKTAKEGIVAADGQ